MKETEISISYIIPAYNAEKTILNLISYLDKKIDVVDEVIVINDGSIDSTLTILENFHSTRISFYSLKENAGVSSARNKGIELANKDYIMFLDSDDSITSSFFQNIKSTISKNNHPDVIRFSNSQANIMWPTKEENLSGIETMKCGYSNSYFLHTSCTQLINYEFLAVNSLFFDESISYGEDLLFSYQLLKEANNCVVMPHQYYVYNFEPNSTSNSADTEKIINRIRDISKVYDYILDTVGDELVIIFEIKYLNELSMQLMKLYQSDAKSYREIIISKKKTISRFTTMKYRLNNIYKMYMFLLTTNSFLSKILLKLLLFSYKNMITIRNHAIKLRKKGSSIDI